MMGEFCDTRANFFFVFSCDRYTNAKKQFLKNIRPHFDHHLVSVSAKLISIHQNNSCYSEIKQIDVLLMTIAKLLSNLCQSCCPTLVKGIANSLINAFSMFDKSLFNAWQMFFPTFGKCFSQRLANVFPNVWQMYFPTFGKCIFQRLIKIFSRLKKVLINNSEPINIHGLLS